jgi:hypothetical protein
VEQKQELSTTAQQVVGFVKDCEVCAFWCECSIVLDVVITVDQEIASVAGQRLNVGTRRSD